MTQHRPKYRLKSGIRRRHLRIIPIHLHPHYPDSTDDLYRGTMLGMDRRALLQAMGAAAIVPFTSETALQAQSTNKAVDSATVYELRIYHTPEGKLEPLLTRFRTR